MGQTANSNQRPDKSFHLLAIPLALHSVKGVPALNKSRIKCERKETAHRVW
jgi:hypothetical protein